MDFTQPYSPPGVSNSNGGHSPAGITFLPTKPWRPPRIWPIFAALSAAFMGGIMGQAVLFIIILGIKVSQGVEQEAAQQQLMDMATTPLGLMLLSTPMQIAFLGSAIGAARLSPIRSFDRLGLAAPQAPKWAYPVLVLGSLAPAMVGAGLASLFVAAAQWMRLVDEATLMENDLYSKMTPGVIIPFTLFVAIVPAFCEEFFFRGYAQRRLNRRFGPLHAIMISTSLFAFVHINPLQVVFVIPIGLYLGYVSWRTNSIWLAIAGHALVNSCWNVWRVFFMPDLGDLISTSFNMVLLAAFASGSFLISMMIIRRLPPSQGREWPPPRAAQDLAPTPIVATLAEPEPIVATLAPDRPLDEGIRFDPD